MKPGTKLICINKVGWITLETGKDSTGPEYGEIVTLADTVDTKYGVAYILQEYDGEYYHRGFVPLAGNEHLLEDEVDITELTEILETEPALL